MKADRVYLFKILVLAVLVCGCVATKTSSKKKGKKTAQEISEEGGTNNGTNNGVKGGLPKSATTCPKQVSEAKFCQVFTQEGGGGNRPLDILWVIDNSGSMGDDQERLALNFEKFINGFAGRVQNADFQMEIITTDNSTNRDSEGKLNGTYLRSNRLDFVQYFQSKVKVGASGSGTEKGLFYSLDFLKKYSSWVRSNAYLITIYLSDENDFSNIPSNASSNADEDVARAFFQSLSGTKTSPQLFKAFVIVDTSAGGARALRYVTLAQLSGGKSYDIITDSFDTILQDFGNELAKIASQFQLKYPAQMGTVEVYIDGVIASQGDWSYLQGQNAIRFKEGLFAEKKGKSAIKVTYQTK